MGNMMNIKPTEKQSSDGGKSVSAIGNNYYPKRRESGDEF
jgi:hypothetical protein